MGSAVYAPNVNKVFVFGGEDAVSGVNYNINRIYDVVAGTWTTGAPMPDVRSFMAFPSRECRQVHQTEEASC